MQGPRSFGAREPALVRCVLAFALLGGCSDGPDASRDAQPRATDEWPRDVEIAGPTSPEGRIERELEQIRRTTGDEHRYLGDRAARDFRAHLEQTVGRAAPLDEARARYRLGTAELILGREDEAIEQFEKARAIADTLGDAVPAGPRAELYFALGVAWLRKGESENCCARHTEESCLLPIRGDGVHVLPTGSRNAMQAFLDTLAATEPDSPEALRALWLLNVAAMTLGEHPNAVPSRFRIPARAFEAQSEFPRFRNRAGEAGLANESLAGGAIGDDFDGDGDIDIAVSSWDPAASLHLYRNAGGAKFVDDTEAAGLQAQLGGLNMVQADYDNDGDVDIFVLRGAWLEDKGRHPNSLLQNDGSGRFKDVTYAAGLGLAHFPTQTAAWADIDLDGDLDLYVGNESTPSLRAPSQLFINDGAGSFSDNARAAGVENLRFAKGVAFGDFDSDRYPDLFVSNLGVNRLYKNRGDGTFTDVTEHAGVATPDASFPAWFWDVNQDGNLDLWVAGYSAKVQDVALDFLGKPWSAEYGRLYLGDGSGQFRDGTEDWDLVLPAGTMGANFGDLDGDGWLDFYLGTGYPELWEVMPNRMLRNVGGERFEDVTLAGGFGHLQKGHGVVFADLDDDGDIDVFEEMGGAFPVDRYVDAYYENPGFGHKYLRLQLVGATSNRFGVGCRIVVTVVDENGEHRRLHRRAGFGGSFGGNPHTRLTLGLGAARSVERVEVYWPASDSTTTLDSPPLGASVTLREAPTP